MVHVDQKVVAAFLAGLLLWLPATRGEVLAVAHPADEFDPSDTAVWTPVFQAAWEAADRAVGAELIESGSEAAKRLDDFEWKPDEVLPPDRWRVWSGLATPALHREAAVGAREMLGGAAVVFPEIEGRRNGEGEVVTTAAYALLDVDMRYFRPLYRSKERGMIFTDAGGEAGSVHFFGVRGAASERFSRIRVLHRSEKSHALQIPATNSEVLGDLVLYLPEEPEDFEAAFSRVRTWRKEWVEKLNERSRHWYGENDPGFHKQDELRVPYVRFRSSSDFSESLTGWRRYRGKPLPYKVVEAWQKVDFLLGEKGAEVRVIAGAGLEPFGEPPKPFPRKFFFDRPFFVMLWREEAERPYFAAWVGAREAMKPWQ